MIYMEKIRDYVSENQANAPLYTLKHIFPATERGLDLAFELEADPGVVEAGLLLHDIGYHKTYESKEKDHIIRGMAIASDLLSSKLNLPMDYANAVIDTIRTHDGRLESISPIENIIVNDADQVAVFAELPWMYELMRTAFKMSHERALSGCLQEAWKSYNKVISLDYTKERFEQEYELTKQWLKRQVSMVPKESLYKNPPREDSEETFKFLEELLA